MRYKSSLVIAVLIGIKSVSLFADIIPQEGGGFEVGVSLDDCADITNTVSIYGTCTWQYNPPAGVYGLGDPAGGTINMDDQNIPSNYSTTHSGTLADGTFIGIPSTGSAYFNAQMSITIVPYSYNGTTSPQNIPSAIQQQAVQNGQQLNPPHLAYSVAGTNNPCGDGYDLNNYALNYTNNTASPQYNPATGQTLAPGQSTSEDAEFGIGSTWTTSWQELNPNTGNFQDAGTTTVGLSAASTNVNYVNQTNSSTNIPLPDGADSFTLATSSNGPIVWSSANAAAATNPAVVDEAGFSAVDETLLQQLDAQSNELAALQKLSNSGGGTVSLSGSNINLSGASNVWVENWPTNLISVNQNTNSSGSSSNVWVQNWPTNQTFQAMTNLTGGADAQSVSNAAAAGYGDGGIGNWVSNNVPTAPPDADGDSSPLSMTMLGATLNFDPASTTGPLGSSGPGVCQFIRQGIALVLSLGFLYWLAEKYWSLSIAKAGGLKIGGNVPDMEVEVGGEILAEGVTTGGNWLGVLKWWACQAIMVGLWVGLNVAFFSVCLTWFGLASGSDPNISGVTPSSWLAQLPSLGASGQVAKHLLFVLMPVHWGFTLLLARITLTFSLGLSLDFASFVATKLP